MSNRVAGPLVVIGVLLFLANIAFAWWTMHDTNTYVTTAPDRPTIAAYAEPLRGLDGHSATNVVQYSIRAMEADIHLKAVSNKQSLVATAMAGAFSLIAVGLSLFVLGARGALDVQIDVPDRGKMLLQSTSPGLVCFLLSAIVICVCVTQRTSIDLQPYALQGAPIVGTEGSESGEGPTIDANRSLEEIQELLERGKKGAGPGK